MLANITEMISTQLIAARCCPPLVYHSYFATIASDTGNTPSRKVRYTSLLVRPAVETTRPKPEVKPVVPFHTNSSRISSPKITDPQQQPVKHQSYLINNAIGKQRQPYSPVELSTRMWMPSGKRQLAMISFVDRTLNMSTVTKLLLAARE